MENRTYIPERVASEAMEKIADDYRKKHGIPDNVSDTEIMDRIQNDVYNRVNPAFRKALEAEV